MNFLNRPIRPSGNQHVCPDSSFSRRVTLLVDVSAHFSHPLSSVTLVTSLDVVSAMSPPCRVVASNHRRQSFRAELEEFLFGFPNHSWWWQAFAFCNAMYFWHHYLTIRFKKEKHHSYKLSQLLHSFIFFFLMAIALIQLQTFPGTHWLEWGRPEDLLRKAWVCVGSSDKHLGPARPCSGRWRRLSEGKWSRGDGVWLSVSKAAA